MPPKPAIPQRSRRRKVEASLAQQPSRSSAYIDLTMELEDEEPVSYRRRAASPAPLPSRSISSTIDSTYASEDRGAPSSEFRGLSRKRARVNDSEDDEAFSIRRREASATLSSSSQPPAKKSRTVASGQKSSGVYHQGEIPKPSPESTIQALLNNTSEQEWVVWRRTIHLFDDAPFCLIPEGATIEIEKNKENTKYLVDHKTGFATIENTNWGDSTWKDFAALLCCPAFQEIGFLHHAIKTALHHRLHDDDDEPSLPNARIRATILDLEAEFRLGEDGRATITTILNRHLKDHVSNHLGFIPFIKDAVKHPRAPRATSNGPEKHLTFADFKNIKTAWGNYAWRPENGLKSIKDYQKKFGETKLAIDRAIILNKKKKWLEDRLLPSREE